MYFGLFLACSYVLTYLKRLSCFFQCLISCNSLANWEIPFFRYLTPKGRCINLLKSFSYVSVSASIIDTSHINVSRSSYKVPGKTVVTIPNVTFRGNASGGSRFFLCERADWHDEASSRYSLCERPWKSILNTIGGCGLDLSSPGQGPVAVCSLFSGLCCLLSVSDEVSLE